MEDVRIDTSLSILSESGSKWSDIFDLPEILICRLETSFEFWSDSLFRVPSYMRCQVPRVSVSTGSDLWST